MQSRKFLKTVPAKLYLLLFSLIVFSFFSNDFGLVDIQKTAIILAAGVDKAENGFSLTAQIAVPKGTDRTTGGTSSVNVQAEGKTISECVSLIFAKTGWVPKLAFCDLIVLSEDAVQDNAINYLNYFLRSEYMNDACQLAVCEGSASDLLASKSATSDTSAIGIEKLFSQAAEKAGRTMPNTLKDFSIGYYGKSESSYLPYIRSKKQKSAGGESDPSAGSGSGGGESGGGGGAEETIYTADETALFFQGKMVALLSPEETFAFSLLEGSVKTGTFCTETTGKAVTLEIMSNKGGISLDMKGTPKVKFKFEIVVRLCCRGTTAPMEDISSDGVEPNILERAKETLTQHISSLWEKSKESGCDLFELKNKLYRFTPSKYGEWKDYFPRVAEPQILANLKSM